MKTSTLKRPANRLGAAFAIATCLAFGVATRALAADHFWVGSTTDGNFASKSNWVDKDGKNPSGSPVGNSSSNQLYFNPLYKLSNGKKADFDQTFTNNNFTVKFYSALSHKAKLHFKGAGTAEHPIVFQSKDGTLGYGLKINDSKIGWHIGCDSGDAYLTLATGKYEASDYWYVGGSSTEGHLTVSAGAFAKSGGDFNVYNGTVDVAGTLDAKQIFLATNTVDKTAEMTIEGGTVTNRSGAFYVSYVAGASGALNLNEGGTLVTRNVYVQDGTGTLVFNGGTLKAKEAYSSYGGLIGPTVTTTVGEKGGTIDTGNLNVTLGSAISNAPGVDGAMTVKGGGSLTITVAQGYTGGTTVELGTVLKLDSTSKSSILDNGVTVSVPGSGVTEGQVVLQMTGGTFTEEDASKVNVTGNADYMAVADGGSIAINRRRKGSMVIFR